MGLSIPSEVQLADAIQALKPGSFERLVEAYLRAKEPHRFRDLSIIGRNPDDVTRQGWPDAEVRRADGRIDAIEVTHSPNWRQHLRADLLRIQELGGRIASFLFVAWADAPSREEEQTCRKDIAACGIPLQEVTFLFRKQLLFDLGGPRYARLWADPLRLPLTSFPFIPVDAAHQLFGSDDDPAHFRPSRSEFCDGRVYRPQLQDTVLQLLETTGWAFLRGRGASGKTTMATSIAMSRADRPVYYIDLTDWDAIDESRAIDTLLTRADDQVLFVIDNVHLEPEFTRRLFDIWYEARNGSHLLLLGRVTTPRLPHRGHAHPLRDLETGAVDLLVQSRDLLGVYRRLLRRLRPSNEPLEPPVHVLDDWLRLFAGDLLAFSAAVSRRGLALSQGEFTLHAEDASEYVLREYLQELDAAERQALDSLSVLAELEVSASLVSIGGHFPTRSSARGLVLRTSTLDEKRTRLRLVHPGMGRLLLAAAGEPVDSARMLTRAATADPEIGLDIVKRLRRLGRHTQARRLLKHIVSQDKWFSAPFTPAYLKPTARLLRRSGVLGTADLEARLLQEPRFLSELLTTPLHGLTSFLVFSRRYMPELHKAATRFLSDDTAATAIARICLDSRPRLLPQFIGICRDDIPRLAVALRRELQTPTNVRGLVSNFVEGPLTDLGIFLRDGSPDLPDVHSALIRELSDASTNRQMADQALMESFGPLSFLLDVTRLSAPSLFEAVIDVLNTPQGVEHLSREATRTDLRVVLRFLQVASERLPKVCEAVADELNSSQNLAAIAARLLQIPIVDLTATLGVANSVSPSLHSRLVFALSEPANLAILVNRAIAAPLDMIVHILEFSRIRIPPLYAKLRDSLAQPDVVNGLRERSIEAPISQLTAFLRVGEIAIPFLRSLDSTWVALKREMLSIETLADLSGLVVALRQCSRSDLAAEIAQDAFLMSRDSQWRSGFKLHCLGTLLQAVNPACSENIDRFLAVVCNDDWLRSQVQPADPGVLASTMFRLWSALTPDQLWHFQVEWIGQAMANHVRLALDRPNDLEGLATAISLTGVASILGFRPDPSTLEMLSSVPVDAIIIRRESNRNSLTVGEVQLWLGIRVLANAGFRQIRVSSARGDSVLRRWRAAQTANEKYLSLNRSVVDWLEHCASKGWLLVGA